MGFTNANIMVSNLYWQVYADKATIQVIYYYQTDETVYKCNSFDSKLITLKRLYMIGS